MNRAYRPVLHAIAVFVTMVAPAAEPAIFFQAHRGGLDEVPENTLAALEHAWAIPGAVPEVDIRTTADGVPVIIHDATPRRTTDAPAEWADKNIRAIPLDTLRQWDAGAGFGSGYAGAKVPTLDEVLAMLAARPERQLYLDLKDIEPARLIAILKARGVTDRVLFVHGSPETCRELSRAWPGARTMTWLSGDPKAVKARFRELAAGGFEGITQIQLHLRPAEGGGAGRYALDGAFLEEAVETARAAGATLQVRPFLFDPPSLRALIDLGIEWYVADAPKALYEALQAARALRVE